MGLAQHPVLRGPFKLLVTLGPRIHVPCLLEQDVPRGSAACPLAVQREAEETGEGEGLAGGHRAQAFSSHLFWLFLSPLAPSVSTPPQRFWPQPWGRPSFLCPYSPASAPLGRWWAEGSAAAGGPGSRHS